MNILLLAGSPSTPSRSTRLLHHVGEPLALLGYRHVKLCIRGCLAVDSNHGLQLLQQVEADVIKVDVREITDEAAALKLLQVTADRNVRVVFKRVESLAVREKLIRLGILAQQSITAQGYLWDQPKASVLQLNDAEHGVIAA